MVYFIFVQIVIDYSLYKYWRLDQTQRSVASDLGPYCLDMSHKKGAMLIRVSLLKTNS